jgi:excisionase family DNA binding protein
VASGYTCAAVALRYCFGAKKDIVSERKLIKLKELTKTVAVSEVTLNRWARNGIIPSVKCGGMWLIPESFVSELLAAAQERGGAR